MGAGSQEGTLVIRSVWAHVQLCTCLMESTQKGTTHDSLAVSTNLHSPSHPPPVVMVSQRCIWVSLLISVSPLPRLA